MQRFPLMSLAWLLSVAAGAISLSLSLPVSLLCVFCYATRSKSTGHTAKWHVRQHKLHILGSTLQYADAINHNKRPHCANAANDDSRTKKKHKNNNNKLSTIELCLVGRGKALQHAARSAGQHLSHILAHAIKIGLLIILAKGHGSTPAPNFVFTHTHTHTYTERIFCAA